MVPVKKIVTMKENTRIHMFTKHAYRLNENLMQNLKRFYLVFRCNTLFMAIRPVFSIELNVWMNLPNMAINAFVMAFVKILIVDVMTGAFANVSLFREVYTVIGMREETYIFAVWLNWCLYASGALNGKINCSWKIWFSCFFKKITFKFL